MNKKEILETMVKAYNEEFNLEWNDKSWAKKWEIFDEEWEHVASVKDTNNKKRSVKDCISSMTKTLMNLERRSAEISKESEIRTTFNKFISSLGLEKIKIDWGNE